MGNYFDEIQHLKHSEYGGPQPVITDTRVDLNETEDVSMADQWVEYIQPLVTFALEEVKEGINLTHLFQEYILAGVLVGQGFSPEEAIAQVEDWEKTGESQLLKESKQMD
ncbi:hypothetical protein [Alkalihalophilus marmarensis]|uniref:hypothetical protein n=1 Tax=Alkalihalophilus marmarensis TaxID=521377 RepID=UPI002E24BCAE|nr:hypothetical protein [Alkalihalophilus marmarensis]